MYTRSLIEIMTYKALVIVITCVIYRIISSASIVQVGEIFDGSNQNKELAFEVAVDMVNNQQRISHKTLKPLSGHIQAEDIINAKQGIVIDITWNNPYTALEVTCSILKKGVMGIFNLLTEDNSDTVKSICDAKEIPVIQTTLDYGYHKDCCAINLFPHPPILSRAFVELIKRWNWKSFTIIYENTQSLPRISEILKSFDAKSYSITIRQLYLNENGNYMTALKDIRRSSQTQFVLDCSSENLNEILDQAQQIGLTMRDYSYIILNLDLQTIDISAFQFTNTNITGFRLFDPLNPAVIEVAQALRNKREMWGFQLETHNSYEDAWKLQTDIILLVDAVVLFAEVLKDHRNLKSKVLFCNTTDNWERGSTLFNYMKTKTIDGLSGKVEFDNRGFRTDFSLDIIELNESGIIKIGTWSLHEGLIISRAYPNLKSSDGDSLVNITFNVMVAENHPYTMLKDTSAQITGNDQYEGFAIDIIKELAFLEGFNYTFVRNEDDKNGDYNPVTNTWSGMIGDVLSGKGDLAIGDLTITRQRQEYVDFTSPFMSLGVQILYTKPKQSVPGFFSFAKPFHIDVWILLGITFFVMACMFYIIARLCPAEWCNPFPCLENPQYLLNKYNIGNCLWLIIGNLMQEGVDIAPRGLSTRVLSSFWSFFILIMLSTYTANMAAFLTAEKEVWLFNDVRELVDRADKLGITYGALANGSTYKLFQESENDLYRRIGTYMNSHPQFMVPWYELGIDMVKDPKKNYAFFMESSSIKYVTERICNLTAVGYFLDEKYYGIAMRKNSTYRSRLSAAVLKLTEMGKIAALERKWWQQERGAGECSKVQFESAPPLNYKHISGIIWITCGGIMLSCVTVFFELVLHVIVKCRTCKQRIQLLKRELKLYFNFETNVKPAAKSISVKSKRTTDT